MVKQVNDVRDLRAGDTVSVVWHDGQNYSENDPLGWSATVMRVVALEGELLGPDSVTLAELGKGGQWPHEEPVLGEPMELYEKDPIRQVVGHGADNYAAEVFLLHRKGEFNDESDDVLD